MISPPFPQEVNSNLWISCLSFPLVNNLVSNEDQFAKMNPRELIIYQIQLLKRKYESLSGNNTWLYVGSIIKTGQRRILSTGDLRVRYSGHCLHIHSPIPQSKMSLPQRTSTPSESLVSKFQSSFYATVYHNKRPYFL